METIRLGSGDLLDMLYDTTDGEENFITLCEKLLKKKIVFDQQNYDYIVSDKL